MEAIGLYNEGKILRLAHLKKEKNTFKILALESVILKDTPGENKENSNTGQIEQPAEEDVFGITNGIITESQIKNSQNRIDEKSNMEVIFDLLSKYELRKIPLGLSLSHTSVNYSDFKNSDGLSGRKLENAIKKQAGLFENDEEDEFQIEHKYINSRDDLYMIMSHSGKSNLLEEILDTKPLLDKKMRVKLLFTLETALSNLYNLHTGNVENESALIVYSGGGFSRIIMISKGRIVNVSPIINIDRNDKSYLNTIYAKILLLLDEADSGIPESIYLAGEFKKDQSLQEFKELFPDVSVDFLHTTDNLEYTAPDELFDEDIALYSISLGLAAGILQKSEKENEEVNFLPKWLKKEQSSSRIAWHGYAAMLVLFASTLYYTFNWFYYTDQLEKTGFEILLADESLAIEERISQDIISFESTTQKYLNHISLIDSLKGEEPEFSSTVHHLADNISGINSTWIEKLTMRIGVFSLSGASIYSSRAHRLALKTGNAEVNNLRREKVREYNVYNFDITGTPANFSDNEIVDNQANIGKSKNTTAENILAFKRRK